MRHVPHPTDFDWREGNEAKHVAKHGVSFATAARVFLDADRIEVADLRANRYGELRWNTIGFVDGRCLHVTYAMQDDTAWIISARPAHRKERKAYGYVPPETEP